MYENKIYFRYYILDERKKNEDFAQKAKNISSKILPKAKN